MNNKTAKLIRQEVRKNYGIDEYIDIEGVKTPNAQFKKICRMIKKEYIKLSHDKKVKFKKMEFINSL